MQELKIYVEVKNVYGNDLVYPHCDKAKLFARVANTKTLGKIQVDAIKKLGYLILTHHFLEV